MNAYIDELNTFFICYDKIKFFLQFRIFMQVENMIFYNAVNVLAFFLSIHCLCAPFVQSFASDHKKVIDYLFFFLSSFSNNFFNYLRK